MTDIFIVIYLNDILIFSNSLEIIDSRPMRLERLHEYDLHWKPEKCLFNTQKIEFLGFMVTPTVLRPVNPSESSQLDDRSLWSDTDLLVNHRPYPSIADWCTQASVPIPTFGASTRSLIKKHQPLFPRIVITHADSFQPNIAVANFVCTLDLSLLHARCPNAWH